MINIPTAEKARKYTKANGLTAIENAKEDLRCGIISKINDGETTYISNNKNVIEAGRELKDFLEEKGYSVEFFHGMAIIIKWDEE